MMSEVRADAVDCECAASRVQHTLAIWRTWARKGAVAAAARRAQLIAIISSRCHVESQPLPVGADVGTDSPQARTDVGELGAFICRLREVSTAREDRTLTAALAALEQALEDWRTSERELAHTLCAYESAEHAASRSGLRLEALFELVTTLVEEAEPGRQRHRRRSMSLPTKLRLVRQPSPVLRADPEGGGAPSPTAASATEVAVLSASPAGWASEELSSNASAATPSSHESTPEGSTVQVCVLGRFTVRLDGKEVRSLSGVKARAVLRYLIANRDRAVPKEVLQELLWPDTDPEVARRNLHQAVYTLRRALRASSVLKDLVLFENNCYRLNPGLRLWCDLDVFETSIEAGRRREEHGDMIGAVREYRRAVELYHGDFLEESPYEEWAVAPRDRIRLMFIDTSNRLGDMLLTQEEVDEALAVSQRILANEPADEAAHRRIMRCQLIRGQRHLALRQYKSCVESVSSLYDMTPSPETVALFDAIRV